MQQAVVPMVRHKRGIAFTSGGILGLIAGIIILGVGILNGVLGMTPLSSNANVFSWLLIGAFFGAPLLGALIGTLRSGRFGTGVLSGLWGGFLVAIFLDILIFILYFVKAPAPPSSQTVHQTQSILSQYGLNVSAQALQSATSPQATLVGIIFAAAVMIVVWLGIGAFLGIIGGAIGKIFVHHPRDYVLETPKPTLGRSPRP
jgi:MFS family permease